MIWFFVVASTMVHGITLLSLNTTRTRLLMLERRLFPIARNRNDAR